MPSLFHIRGYVVYICLNESGEPLHVHVSRGKPTDNATKIWLTSKGSTVVEHNRSGIPREDLHLIEQAIRDNYFMIQCTWLSSFNGVSYYC